MSLPNGQKFNLLNLALLGTDQYEQNFHQLLSKMEDMQLDVSEYILIKFILLLNSGWYPTEVLLAITADIKR
jgi:hypothetical protein